MAGVSADDVVFDLGCNDGRVCITAAREHGARGVGIEIDAGAVNKAKRLVSTKAERAGRFFALALRSGGRARERKSYSWFSCHLRVACDIQPPVWRVTSIRLFALRVMRVKRKRGEKNRHRPHAHDPLQPSSNLQTVRLDCPSACTRDGGIFVVVIIVFVSHRSCLRRRRRAPLASGERGGRRGAGGAQTGQRGEGESQVRHRRLRVSAAQGKPQDLAKADARPLPRRRRDDVRVSAALGGVGRAPGGHQGGVEHAGEDQNGGGCVQLQ